MSARKRAYTVDVLYILLRYSTHIPVVEYVATTHRPHTACSTPTVRLGPGVDAAYFLGKFGVHFQSHLAQPAQRVASHLDAHLCAYEASDVCAHTRQRTRTRADARPRWYAARNETPRCDLVTSSNSRRTRAMNRSSHAAAIVPRQWRQRGDPGCWSRPCDHDRDLPLRCRIRCDCRGTMASRAGGVAVKVSLLARCLKRASASCRCSR